MRHRSRAPVTLAIIATMFAAMIVACGGDSDPAPDPAPSAAPSFLPSTIPASATAVAHPTATGGQDRLRTVAAQVGTVTLTLEVADDSAERVSGLSGRPGLDDQSGMLFVFDDTALHTLWMRDMHFALDFVWLDDARAVVHIERDVPPQPGVPESELLRYGSVAPARYAIELEAGGAAALGIESGATIAFDLAATTAPVPPGAQP